MNQSAYSRWNDDTILPHFQLMNCSSKTYLASLYYESLEKQLMNDT